MATKTIAWQTGSGNITLTYQGQGDGPISVVSDPNDTGSARSKSITISTTKGGVITKNVTVSQAACPFPVGDVRNFAYTGTLRAIHDNNNLVFASYAGLDTGDFKVVKGDGTLVTKLWS